MTSPTKLTPVFSKKFDVCGMFKDSTMAVHKLRLEAIEEQRKKAWQHLQRHKIKLEMFAILKENYKFS